MCANCLELIKSPARHVKLSSTMLRKLISGEQVAIVFNFEGIGSPIVCAGSNN